jgi:hypothetical protein
MSDFFKNSLTGAYVFADAVIFWKKKFLFKLNRAVYESETSREFQKVMYVLHLKWCNLGQPFLIIYMPACILVPTRTASHLLTHKF